MKKIRLTEVFKIKEANIDWDSFTTGRSGKERGLSPEDPMYDDPGRVGSLGLVKDLKKFGG